MSHRHEPFLRTFPNLHSAARAFQPRPLVFGGLKRYDQTGAEYLLSGMAGFVVVLALLIAPAAFGFSRAAAQDADTIGPAAPSRGGQDAPVLLTELLDAFGRGDARGVVNCSSRRLDVTIFGVSELFSQSQVSYVLRDFFANYPPQKLNVTETSGSIDNWFAAGHYWYRRGDAPLSVYFRLRLSGGEWKLREVRIGRTIHR